MFGINHFGFFDYIGENVQKLIFDWQVDYELRNMKLKK